MNTIGPTTKLIPLTVEERLEQEPKYTEAINLLLSTLEDEQWEAFAMLMGVRPPITTEDKIDMLYRILVPIF